MPTREDIIKQLSIISQYCERQDVELAIDEVIAEVSAMRCETCDHRIYTSSCSKFNRHILGLDKGCFSHEQKVIE
jgi:hypothetical protein